MVPLQGDETPSGVQRPMTVFAEGQDGSKPKLASSLRSLNKVLQTQYNIPTSPKSQTTHGDADKNRIVNFYSQPNELFQKAAGAAGGAKRTRYLPAEKRTDAETYQTQTYASQERASSMKRAKEKNVRNNSNLQIPRSVYEKK